MNASEFNIDHYGYSDDPNYMDWCLGQTIQALLDIGHDQLADLLLECNVSWRWASHDDGFTWVIATLHGPMRVISRFIDIDQSTKSPDTVNDLRKRLDRTFELVLGPNIGVQNWTFQAGVINLPTNWREQLSAETRKKGTTNQGRFIPPDTPHKYANLYFRSPSEVRIAQALDAHKVMYFANCTARLDKGGERTNLEPDFLICYQGRWGMLEVDGATYHTSAAKDHDRDRVFQQYKVRVIHHYTSTRCEQEPNQVVAEFLDLLAKNG